MLRFAARLALAYAVERWLAREDRIEASPAHIATLSADKILRGTLNATVELTPEYRLISGNVDVDDILADEIISIGKAPRFIHAYGDRWVVWP